METVLLMEPPNEHQPGQHLDFRLLASRAIREYISVILSHPVCSTLLRQPLDTNVLCRRRKKIFMLIMVIILVRVYKNRIKFLSVEVLLHNFKIPVCILTSWFGVAWLKIQGNTLDMYLTWLTLMASQKKKKKLDSHSPRQPHVTTAWEKVYHTSQGTLGRENEQWFINQGQLEMPMGWSQYLQALVCEGATSHQDNSIYLPPRWTAAGDKSFQCG